MENLLLTYFMDVKTNIFQNRKSGEEFGTALHCFVNSAKVLPNRRHLPSYAFSLCAMCMLLWWKHMKKNPG